MVKIKVLKRLKVLILQIKKKNKKQDKMEMEIAASNLHSSFCLRTDLFVVVYVRILHQLNFAESKKSLLQLLVS